MNKQKLNNYKSCRKSNSKVIRKESSRRDLWPLLFKMLALSLKKSLSIYLHRKKGRPKKGRSLDGPNQQNKEKMKRNSRLMIYLTSSKKMSSRIIWLMKKLLKCWQSLKEGYKKWRRVGQKMRETGKRSKSIEFMRQKLNNKIKMIFWAEFQGILRRNQLPVKRQLRGCNNWRKRNNRKNGTNTRLQIRNHKQVWTGRSPKMWLMKFFVTTQSSSITAINQ